LNASEQPDRSGNGFRLRENVATESVLCVGGAVGYDEARRPGRMTDSGNYLHRDIGQRGNAGEVRALGGHNVG
jgi:hypothetical protein